MNEKSIDQIEEEVLIYEISDEAVEAAGTRTEIAGVWTRTEALPQDHTWPERGAD